MISSLQWYYNFEFYVSRVEIAYLKSNVYACLDPMLAVLAEDDSCKKWPETCSFRIFLHPGKGVRFEQVFVLHGENAVHMKRKKMP